MENIKIIKSEITKIENADWDNLRFGVYFSDHIYVSEYKNEKWDSGTIQPYGTMDMEPANCTLHYGQTIFEGLKAFPSVKGGVNIFRPDMNGKRMIGSAKAVCIPPYPLENFVEAVKEIVTIDKKWIPKKRGESLYIRPFSFGTGNFLGVNASDTYKFIIILSPVASYYKEGLNPIKILVEVDRVRAVRGGLGAAKTAANYAASMFAGQLAHKKGFSQVLWLDGVYRKHIDEVGAMNIMFVVDNELITPSLEKGNILAGVTRDSVIHLAKEFGLKVVERDILIDEIVEAYEKGFLKEAFGTGTAAVISPVGLLNFKGKDMVINDMKIGKLTQKFYDTITGIQYGEIEDKYNWIVHLDI
ncbi:MAG: branched-chain amino acid aminotransferase [Ignavibacteria bacterium]|jgi:branched-chain amino acid aminotransferase